MTIVTFPDSPYRLHQPFEPAGDQPVAIAQLVEGIEDGLAFQTLLGVTGSGKTFTMANVIARTGRPAIVMAPNKTLAAQLYSELRDFFPENAVEYFVSYYDYYQPEAYVPSRDVYIEKDSSINEQIEQMRLSATKSLLEREDAVIVATHYVTPRSTTLQAIETIKLERVARIAFYQFCGHAVVPTRITNTWDWLHQEHRKLFYCKYNTSCDTLNQ